MYTAPVILLIIAYTPATVPLFRASKAAFRFLVSAPAALKSPDQIKITSLEETSKTRPEVESSLSG